MKISVKAADFYQEVTLSKQQAQKLHRDVWAKLRAVSLAAERRIKDAMPVLTGRARASWGHWTPGDVHNPKANAGDAHYKEDDANLTIEQGSNVEYIEALNAGHSQKAPAGFIDTAELNTQRELDAEIDAVLARYF